MSTPRSAARVESIANCPLLTALPLRVSASRSSLLMTKPLPSVLASSSRSPGLCAQAETMCALLSMSTIVRTGSPKPRAPGSLSAPSV